MSTVHTVIRDHGNVRYMYCTGILAVREYCALFFPFESCYGSVCLYVKNSAICSLTGSIFHTYRYWTSGAKQTELPQNGFGMEHLCSGKGYLGFQLKLRWVVNEHHLQAGSGLAAAPHSVLWRKLVINCWDINNNLRETAGGSRTQNQFLHFKSMHLFSTSRTFLWCILWFGVSLSRNEKALNLI